MAAQEALRLVRAKGKDLTKEEQQKIKDPAGACYLKTPIMYVHLYIHMYTYVHTYIPTYTYTYPWSKSEAYLAEGPDTPFLSIRSQNPE